MIASPYGIATIDLAGVTADCFGPRKTQNFTNKLLLTLKGKRYIYYEARSGRRGSFEVHLGDWPLPREDKSRPVQVRQLDKYFDDIPEVRGMTTIEPVPESEVVAELHVPSQRSESSNFDFESVFSMLGKPSSVRGSDNDTDTHTDKDSDINRNNRTFNSRVPIERFVPSSYEEEQCLGIAQALGEKDMAFILGSMNKYGFLMIEQAWKYCKTTKQFPSARNKGAFFNKILQDFASNRTDYKGDSQTI